MSADHGEIDVRYVPLPYEQRLDSRALTEIEMVVVHCTELPDLATARGYAERIHYRGSATGNSGHYYIDRAGLVYQYVALERVAHHVSDHNRNSVGIELVNRGRYPHWHCSTHQQMMEDYAEAQIQSLLALLAHLQEQLPNLKLIAGHQDLDTRRIPATDKPHTRILRKTDPGPLFPWAQVLAACRLIRVSECSPALR